MKVLMNTGGLAATNAFLIADEDGRQAVICDAPNDTTGQLLDLAQRNGWDVIGLWLTHGHFDHIADHPVIAERFPAAKIAIHELEAPKLRDPEGENMNMPFPVPIIIPPREPDVLLKEGMTLRVGSLEFQVLHTPGHCAGHVCFHCPAQKVLVGGDLIIGGAVGRTDLYDSKTTQLIRSIRRVMSLPGDTRLLPGHGEPSTLDYERQNNPYVQEAVEERT